VRKDITHEDIAAAILDRVLERGRFIHLDGPSEGTRHLNLEQTLPENTKRLRISATHKNIGLHGAMDRFAAERNAQELRVRYVSGRRSQSLSSLNHFRKPCDHPNL
jgi:hypothetical protein